MICLIGLSVFKVNQRFFKFRQDLKPMLVCIASWYCRQDCSCKGDDLGNDNKREKGAIQHVGHELEAQREIIVIKGLMKFIIVVLDDFHHYWRHIHFPYFECHIAETLGHVHADLCFGL